MISLRTDEAHGITLARELLQEVLPSYDWSDEHMQNTPRRLVKMLAEMCTPVEFEFTVFDNTQDLDEMVIIQNIRFYTLCAHHMVPFFGVAHIAYIPSDSIAGLSKFARAVKYVAKGVWVQEHLTDSIANYLEERLCPRGLAVVMEAEHLCMSMRGAQSPGAKTTTSAMRGVFLDPERGARNEFLSLLRGR